MNSSVARTNGIAWCIGLVFAWLWTWRHLAAEWRFNEQYQYAFAVPLLAGAMAWSRLKEKNFATAAPSAGVCSVRVAALLALAGLAFLMGEMLRQVDPTWRLVGWLFTAAATVWTAAWLWQQGGGVLLRLMLFPLCFVWLTLPWPSSIESPITQWLLIQVTSAATLCLNLTGVAALQHGSVIQLSTGFVGVDNACSGIQSFQASLMASLFFVGLHRLSPARSLLLVTLGWCAALAGNLLRIYALTRIVQGQGQAAMESWHGLIGIGVTIGTFGVITVLAQWLGRRTTAAASVGAIRSEVPPVAGRSGFLVATSAACAPLLAWAWFNLLPGGVVSTQVSPLFQLKTNGLLENWRATADRFAPEEVKLLRFSSAEAVNYRSPQFLVQAVHLFWKPEVTIPSLAFSHSPDICLPSAGWEQQGRPDPVSLMVRNRQVRGALFRFSGGGVPYAVLHAVWYGGVQQPFAGTPDSIGGRSDRLLQVWRRVRRQGHETLTVFVPNDADATRLRETLEEVLGVILAPGPEK
jgi:exosortase